MCCKGWQYYLVHLSIETALILICNYSSRILERKTKSICMKRAPANAYDTDKAISYSIGSLTCVARTKYLKSVRGVMGTSWAYILIK